MFELHTERLKILPLNIEQMKLLRDNPAGLEEELFLNEGCNEKYDDKMEEEKNEVIGIIIKRIENNPFNYTWFTMWQIINKTEKKIIGTCGFNGLPDLEGEIEIGYALKPAYQNKGYMPEVLEEMIRYAFMHPKVKAIKAQTPVKLIQSQKLLANLGFEKTFEKDDIFTWKLYNPNFKT